VPAGLCKPDLTGRREGCRHGREEGERIVGTPGNGVDGREVDSIALGMAEVDDKVARRQGDA
jgi:hypothetical protein